MNHIKRDIVKKARRRISMRSALLLTLCACLLCTAGRIALLAVPAAVRPLPGLLLTLLAFGGGAYLGLCELDGDQRKALPRAALGRGQIMHLSLLGMLTVAPATLLSDLWRALFAPGSAAQAAGVVYGAQSALFIVQMIGSALIAPVCEELFFRGYLLAALERYGRARAALVCALCFALAHGVSVGGLLVHALLGVLFGALALKTRSIFAPMLVHGCYNAAIVVIAYSGLAPLFSGLTLASCALRLALLLLCLYVLRRAYTTRGLKKPMQPLDALCFTRRELVLIALSAILVIASEVLA